MCSQGILLKKHKLDELPGGRVACTKRCYEKAQKEAAGGGEEVDGGGRKGNWDCDGLNGPDDPKTSVSILINWWMTEGNYNKFCGKNNNGIKKIQFATELADKMSKETTTQRDTKNVLSKIQHIERTFREAHIFATSETGAGIKDKDEGTFNTAVKKKCPYYYDLIDVMSDRASSKPIATNYDEEDPDDDLSDISEEEKSTVTKRTATTAATDATSSSRKKPKSAGKKKGSALMDDEALDALQRASRNSEAKMTEMVRHHKYLENLEERKLEIEQKREERESKSWRGKTDELDYKMQLIERYQQLKSTYNWTDDQILAFYPDMEQVIRAKDSSSS